MRGGSKRTSIAARFPTGRLMVVVLVSAGVALVSPAAFGSHKHTVNGVGHGMGDTGNPGYDDQIAHPFINRRKGICGRITLYRQGPVRVARKRKCGRHIHITYDTHPRPECIFYGYFEMSRYVNPHFHAPTGYCPEQA